MRIVVHKIGFKVRLFAFEFKIGFQLRLFAFRNKNGFWVRLFAFGYKIDVMALWCARLHL